VTTNLWDDLPPTSAGDETIEQILKSGPLRIERIVSHGQISPEDFWYDQHENEWLSVLQGEAKIAFADGTETHLKTGDCVFLPAHKKHRVTHTSTEPPCIWLAVFWQA